YGVDKPDLRNPIIIADVSDVFAREDVSFKAFKGKTVRAIPAPGAESQPRSFFDKLNEWARGEMGAAGLGYIVFDEEMQTGASHVGQKFYDKEIPQNVIGRGPIAKFLSQEAQNALAAAAGIKGGDALFFSADADERRAA